MAVFDLRRAAPLVVKDHMHDAPIKDIKFHTAAGDHTAQQRVISADSHIVKVRGRPLIPGNPFVMSLLSGSGVTCVHAWLAVAVVQYVALYRWMLQHNLQTVCRAMPFKALALDPLVNQPTANARRSRFRQEAGKSEPCAACRCGRCTRARASQASSPTVARSTTSASGRTRACCSLPRTPSTSASTSRLRSARRRNGALPQSSCALRFSVLLVRTAPHSSAFALYSGVLHCPRHAHTCTSTHEMLQQGCTDVAAKDEIAAGATSWRR